MRNRNQPVAYWLSWAFLVIGVVEATAVVVLSPFFEEYNGPRVVYGAGMLEPAGLLVDLVWWNFVEKDNLVGPLFGFLCLLFAIALLWVFSVILYTVLRVFEYFIRRVLDRFTPENENRDITKPDNT